MAVLLLAIVSSVFGFTPKVNDWPDKTQTPVFGILTIPLNQEFKNKFETNSDHYIGSSYVKHLETGGARIVPIFWDSSTEEIDEILTWVNGVLFTGGDFPFWQNNEEPVLTQYAETGCYIYEQVKKIYDNGKFLPLWATCLGFELIHVCERNQFDTISNFTGMPPYSQKQIFTKEAHSSSVFSFMKGRVSGLVMEILKHQDVSSLAHNFGVSPLTYQKSNLGSVFNVLSIMKDKEGKEFVGFVEAIKYPIYATQFHPEKNSFEFYRDNTPHGNDGIFAMNYLAQFIVGLGKKNGNQFPSSELGKRIIYNYQTKFVNYIFMTVYLF